jgi:hypothetical protein
LDLCVAIVIFSFNKIFWLVLHSEWGSMDKHNRTEDWRTVFGNIQSLIFLDFSQTLPSTECSAVGEGHMGQGQYQHGTGRWWKVPGET